MQEPKELLLDLISNYISCSKYVCGLLIELIGSSENIVGAYRTTGVPKEGYLDENVYYNFHGVGCYFEMPNVHIDIDFGPNGRHDGFDIYRLKDFKESNAEKYQLLSDEIIEPTFKNLVKEGFIYNPQWEPSRHLYYLK